MRKKRLFYASSIFALSFLFQALGLFGFQQVGNLSETERRRFAADYIKAKKYHDEGRKFLEKGDLDKAQEKFLLSVGTSPDYAESHVGLGNVYMKKQMFDEAIDEYKKASEAYLRLEAYVARGILVKTGTNRENDVFSRDLYRDLYNREFSVPPHVFLFLGGAYFRKGMLNEALEQFNKAIGLNPEYGEAHNNLAVVYFLKKEYKDAWRHLKIAQKLHAQVNPKFVEELKKAYPERPDHE